MIGRRAVFLVRDGIINRSIVRHGRPFPPANHDELEILPGVVEAIAGFKAAGLVVVIVTNQSDLARGLQSQGVLIHLNDAINKAVASDAIFVCGHDDVDDFPCRKPRRGMLLEAGRRFGIDLSSSVMVGDRWCDISAGKAEGVIPFL